MAAKLKVFVDVNGQPRVSAQSLADCVRVLQPDLIVLAGAANNVGYWSGLLSETKTAGSKLIEIRSPSLRSSGTIDLTSALMELFLQEPPMPEESWVIVSIRDGFSALSDRLDQKCSGRVHWLQTASSHGLHSTVGVTDSVIELVRSIAVAVQAETPRKPVLMAKLANKVSQAIPQINDKTYRKENFGSTRFKDVFASLGMSVVGDSVWVAKPGGK